MSNQKFNSAKDPTVPTVFRVSTHEGHRLKALLKSHGKTIADLRRACEVSFPAAKKYTVTPKIGAKALQTCGRGLVAMGINPDELRPGLSEMVGAIDSPAQQDELMRDLAPWLSTITDEQRLLLRRILVASTEARMRIIDRLTGFTAATAATPSASVPGARTAEEREAIERERLDLEHELRKNKRATTVPQKVAAPPARPAKP